MANGQVDDSYLIGVGLQDNTGIDAQRIMNNLWKVLPGSMRISIGVDENGNEIDQTAEKIKNLFNALKKGTITAEKAQIALRDIYKEVGANEKAQAKQAAEILSTMAKGVAKAEEMQNAVRKFQSQAGKGVDLNFIDKTMGGGKYSIITEYVNQLKTALNGNDWKQVEQLLSSGRQKLLNATMESFRLNIKDFRGGGYASQELLDRLGLPNQEAYDKAIADVRAKERKLSDDISAIMNNTEKTIAQRRSLLKKSMNADGGFAKTMQDIQAATQNLNIPMRFDQSWIAALDTAFARMEVLAKRRQELQKLGFSKTDIDEIMKPYKTWQKSLNNTMSRGDLSAVAEFNMNGLWGQSRKASRAIEHNMNEQLNDVKSRTRLYEKQTAEFSRLQEQMNKLYSKADALNKKGIDTSSARSNIGNNVYLGINKGRSSQDVEQRGAMISIVKKRIEEAKNELREIERFAKEQERSQARIVNMNNALRGIQTGANLLNGQDGRLSLLSSKGMDVKSFITRLDTLNTNINSALNENDLKAKASALASLRTELKQLQGEINNQASKFGADKQALAAIESANRQLQALMRSYNGKDSMLNRWETKGMDVSKLRTSLASIKTDIDGALSSTDLETKRNAIERLKNALAEFTNRANEARTTWGAQKGGFDAAAEAARRYEQELAKINQSHNRANGLISQLGQELAMVYSIQQVRQFLNNIIEIGGQFEQQRKSIAAILGDTYKANVLFNQVKTLGLKSNFTTLELDKYVKELSAFDIQYNELFDKMKKLADISAGTGTDMSRIILAYGHVKAAGYLEGMQRRQFTNANINIVSALRELYSDREGRKVGSKEIYDRIKNKQVTYEDVDRVLMQMAEPGGKFFNMQEVMANTTKGVYKNLGDAMNHMYLALNNTFEKPLITIGKSLTALTKIVANFSTVLAGMGSAFLLTKAATMMYSRAAGKEMVQTLQDVRLLNQKKIKQLELIQSYRALTAAEAEELALRKRSALEAHLFYQRGAEQEVAARGMMLRGVHTGRIGANEAMALYRNGTFKASELQAANSQFARLVALSRSGHANIGRMRYAFAGFANTVKMGLTSMKAAFTSLWSAMWPMLVIEGVIGGITYALNRNKKAAEQAAQMMEALSSTVKGLSETMIQYDRDSFDAMRVDELNQAESDLLTSLKDNLTSNNEILNQIYAKDKDGGFLNNSVDRAKMLYDYIKSTAEELRSIETKSLNKAIESMFDSTSAAKANGDWNNHDLKDQAGYYEESFNKMASAVGKLDDVSRKALKEYIARISEGVEGMKAFRTSTGELNGDLANQIVYLTQLGKIQQSNKGVGYLTDTNGNSFRLSADSENDIANYVSRLEVIRRLWKEAEKNMSADLASLSKDQYKKVIADWLMTNKEMGPKAASDLAEYFKSLRFKVPVSPYLDIRPEDLLKDEHWKKELQSFLNNNKEFSAAITAAADLNSARDACQQLYEGAHKRWENLKKTAKAFSIDINFTLGSGNVSDIKKSLQDRMDVLKNTTGILKNEYREGQIKLLQEMINTLDVYDTGVAAQKSGYLDDPNKNKNSKNGTKKDKLLDDMQDEYRQMQNIVTVYKKYAEVLGDVTAAEKLNNDEELKGIFEKYFTDGIVDDKSISKAYADFLAKLGTAFKNGSSDSKKFYTTVHRDQEGYAITAIKESISDTISAIDRELDKRKGQLNIYQKMFEATGSKDAAAMFAFGTKDTGFSDIDNAAKNVVDLFNDRLARLADKDSVFKNGESPWTVEALEKLSEEERSKLGGNGEIAKMYGEYIKEYENALREESSQFITRLSELQNKSEKILSKRGVNEVLKNTLKRMGASDEMISRIDAKQNDEELKQSIRYMWFFNDAVSMAGSAAQVAGNELKENLNKQLESGAMTADEYYEALNKINEILYKGKEGTMFGKDTPFAAFISGGVKGFREQRLEGLRGNAWKAQQVYEGAKSEYDKAKATGNQWMINAAQIQLDAAKKQMDAANLALQNYNLQTWAEKKNLKDILNVVDIAKAVFEGFSGVFKEVSDTFYSFGNEKKGDKWSNVADAIGVGTAFLQPVSDIVSSAMSGDVAGLVKNAIMAPVKIFTQPIQAINALIDKKHSQKIKYLKRDLSDLQSQYNKLQADMEYTWGTDTLKQYSEELQNLKAQREDIEKMQEEELEKKNSDKDALREYSDQLDELERQTKHFAENAMKTLFGIDFKGWAQKLTSAMRNAFENGEDAALKWHQTVDEIIRDVSESMINKLVMEKAFEPIMARLFTKYGLDEENFDPLHFDWGAFTRDAQSEMYKVGEAIIPQVANAFHAVNDMTPYADSATNGSLQKIGQNLTEQTGSQIAGYANAISGNVGAMRNIVNSQLTQLNNIAKNTLSIDDRLRTQNELLEAVARGDKAFRMK